MSEIYAKRIEFLRAEMQTHGIDFYIVPHDDAYLSEYIAAHTERLDYISGFSGSAGIALIGMNCAHIYSDGRYILQLTKQTDTRIWTTGDSTKTTIGCEIKNIADKKAIIGFDPKTMSVQAVETLIRTLEETKITLKPIDYNLIDHIWKHEGTQPEPHIGTIEIFPESVAGKSVQDKCRDIAQHLRTDNIYGAIIAMPESVSWLLNIRADDIPYTPLVRSTAIIYAEKNTVEWFIDPQRISQEIKDILGPNVALSSPDILPDRLAQLAHSADKPIALDPKKTSYWYTLTLHEHSAEIVHKDDPCAYPRSIKTPSEQDAVRAAHIEDGVAVTRFLHWLDTHDDVHNLDELTACAKLTQFREDGKNYRGPSFATIAGYGANGAIIHYHGDIDSNIAFTEPSLLLVDSGGQYHYGTTDITRTIAIGTPSETMRRMYTLVLKGHIGVASAIFKEGITGADIDAIARAPLQLEGLNYAHGTGHGVGCYLGVHEDASHLSPRCNAAIEDGMLLSNEPGYYQENNFGIRIESLVIAHKQDNDTLNFETITLAPMDLSLIDKSMLDDAEKLWLNAYHEKIKNTLGPLLPTDVHDWLIAKF